MADNVTSNAGSGGATFRAFSDGTVDWPADVPSYVTGGSAGAWTLQYVELAHGLPVQPGTSTTWAISAAALPLPTGAATAANQATANTSLASIDGKITACNTGAVVISSGTVTANIGTTNGLALDATVSGLQVSQGSTTAGQHGNLVQGAVTTAAPSYTTGQTNPLSLTTAGAMRVDGSGVTQPVSGTFWQATQPVSGTVTANAGTGTFTVSGTVTANQGGTWNVGTVTAVTTVSTVTAVTSITNTVTVQGGAASGATAAGNPLQIGGVFNSTQPTVTTGQAVQFQATARGALIVATGVDTFHATIDNSTLAVTQSGTWNVGTVTTVTTVSTVTAVTAITNALPAGTNTIGNTVPVAATSGGATPGRYLAAAAANQDSTVVKNSAGQIYSIVCINVNAAVRYLKLYDKATGPTSADTPVQTFGVPGATTGGGFVLNIPVGMAFANGISFRMTTGQADNDTGAVTAGDLALSYTYK